jgi:hypothetical protein
MEAMVKLLPVTVSMNGHPAIIAVGSVELMTGGGRMENDAGSDVTPPLVTVTKAVPWLAMRAAGIGAVRAPLVKVVVSAVPFQLIPEANVNPVPFTVRVKSGPPAVAEFGLSKEMAGGGSIVKGRSFDGLPPDTTVIVAVPGALIRLAGTLAVIWLAVGRGRRAVVSAVPFQRTVAPSVNPLPFTVRAKPGPPAVAEPGLVEVICGPPCENNAAAEHRKRTVSRSARRR